MTRHQGSPAHTGLPVPPAATARPHDPAGHPATGRRPADLLLTAARKKTALYAPLLLGAAATAVLALAGTAMASPVTGHDATSTVSISPIFGNGDIVTGVRGTTDGNVILTGSHANPDSIPNTNPFLYQGPLTSPADDSGFHVLTPPFAGFETGTFYGPDTSSYNPDTIPAGQVRAVGSYRDQAHDGVLNHGMIYVGPVSGGGSWTTIDVPADGSNTVGGVRACPSGQPDCMVMDTIAHSTMGNLVVGNYDLNLGHGVSGNAFIYNMTTQQWTLLQLGGSLASGTTLYGIWQNGGPGSPNYTLAGGSSAHGSSSGGAQRAFLMNYNEQTGHFGKPRFYSYGNAPAALTHFDGITAVPGGFNLVAISSAQASSMAFVPTTRGNWPLFGRATWYPIDVAGSSLCPGGDCTVTGNTVYQNQVMGLYVSDSVPGTYLATVATP
jgi:hypothetical protein